MRSLRICATGAGRSRRWARALSSRAGISREGISIMTRIRLLGLALRLGASVVIIGPAGAAQSALLKRGDYL